MKQPNRLLVNSDTIVSHFFALWVLKESDLFMNFVPAGKNEPPPKPAGVACVSRDPLYAEIQR